MTARAYYNEFDPKAAAWLRELMALGAIPEGDVDERSILDVRPADLAGYTQCHFFAGIGGWALALRIAGWPDDQPVWTGSPPCQPFSVAGERKGRDDERHLAPHFIGLVRACRPGMLFGEQVASSAVFGKAASGARKQAASAPEWAWLDDLSDRLEAARYAVGATDTPSAGIGAPHIRQRTFFGAYDLGLAAGGMGNCHREGCGRNADVLDRDGRKDQGQRRNDIDGRGTSDGMGNAGSKPGERGSGIVPTTQTERAGSRRPDGRHDHRHSDAREAGILADAERLGRIGRRAGEAGAAPGSVERPDGLRDAGRVGDAVLPRLERHAGDGDDRDEPGRVGTGPVGSVAETGGARRMANVERRTTERLRYEMARAPGQDQGREKEWQRLWSDAGDGGAGGRPGPLNGVWRDADWLFCRDGKWRPVETSTLALADGLPDDLGRGGDPRLAQAWQAAVEEIGFPLGTGMIGRPERLRGYGNAINPWAAAEFIEAFIDAMDEDAP